MIVTSEVIVLNSRKYGDTSKIISVFSIDYGKISLIAKGSRVPKSKFGSSIEPLSCTSTTFYMKPNTDLYLLSNSELTRKWLRIYNSAEHLTAGFNVLETISITQLVKHPNPELFNLLVDVLAFINELHPNPSLAVIWFYCKFAEIMGFELFIPFIEADSNIIYAISIENGSLMGINLPQASSVFKMNSKLLNKFYKVLQSEIYELPDFEFSQTDLITLHNFFGTYFSYHFESKFVLKSGSIF